MGQKQIKLQREIDESTIIIGDFNTLLLEMNRSSKQEISKDISKLKNTIYQLYIIDYFIQKQLNTHCKLMWNIHQDIPHPGP